MSRIHAYYLPDSVSATGEPRPVSVEQLNAIGWNITFISGSGDELVKAGQNRAQELGYPVTEEGGVVKLDLDLEKSAPTLVPKIVALLTKIQESGGDLCTTKDAILLVTSGSPYFHMEDATANAWIHLDVVPGMFIRIPAGGKWRLAFDERNKKAVGTGFFKETVYNHGVLTKTEMENHPIRKAYINALV